jgi:hypothetical protein
MFELVFSACLIADPQSCKDVHLTYEGQRVSLMECAMVGQSEMAKWIEAHPKYRVRKFRCDTPRIAGTEI